MTSDLQGVWFIPDSLSEQIKKHPPKPETLFGRPIVMPVRYYTPFAPRMVAYVERHPDDSIRLVLVTGEKIKPVRKWDSRDESRTEITEEEAFNLLCVPGFSLQS